jgi:hypothetical protein
MKNNTPIIMMGLTPDFLASAAAAMGLYFFKFFSK